MSSPRCDLVRDTRRRDCACGCPRMDHDLIVWHKRWGGCTLCACTSYREVPREEGVSVRALAWLRTQDTFSRRDLTAALGAPYSTANALLVRLLRWGVVERVGAGRYQAKNEPALDVTAED